MSFQTPPTEVVVWKDGASPIGGELVVAGKEPMPQRKVVRHADGVYFDLAEAEYRADPAISQSQLKHFGRSPAHFLASLHEPPSEPTAEQLFGRVVHAMVLTPDRLDEFAVRPAGIHGNSKEARTWAEQYANYTRVSAEMWQRAQRAAAAVREHPGAAQALFSGAAEVSLFYRTQFGMRTKARLDWLPAGSNMLVDLKTANNAEPSAYLRAAIQHDYPSQAACYMLIYNALRPDDVRTGFMHIVVESEPPHVVQTFQFSSKFIRMGGQLYVHRLMLYLECIRKNHWPGYTDDCAVLEPPESFALKL